MEVRNDSQTWISIGEAARKALGSAIERRAEADARRAKERQRAKERRQRLAGWQRCGRVRR